MASTTEPLPPVSTADAHRLFILNAVNELITHLENTDLNNRSFPASKASIDALPAIKLTEDCAICLDDQDQKHEEGTEMPCKHKFHKKCVENWLKMNGNCPICRYRMPEEESSADDDMSTVGSDEEVRARVTIVFFSASRLGSHEADEQEQ